MSNACDCCLVVVLGLIASVGCGAKDQRATQPGYSTVPCAENCGSDPACAARCSNINNQAPLPAGMQPFRR